ncbi:MAG: DUF554 domain-containing protein [Christensenellales bacterium]
MLGVLVNTGAILIGSLIGLLLKKGIPQRITDAIIKGLGLCVIYIGFSGTLKGENVLILIFSIAIGTVIGHLIDLDARLTRGVEKLERRFKKEGQKTNFSEGFITASLVFCVGAMAVVGSLRAGLMGDNQMLFTKALLDFVSSIVFAASLGIGVMASAVAIFIFQGGIVLLSHFIAPLLSDVVIAEMTCVGSLLIFALGLNLIGVTKFKVMNYLPSVFFPILLCLIIK